MDDELRRYAHQQNGKLRQRMYDLLLSLSVRDPQKALPAPIGDGTIACALRYGWIRLSRDHISGGKLWYLTPDGDEERIKDHKGRRVTRTPVRYR